MRRAALLLLVSLAFSADARAQAVPVVKAVVQPDYLDPPIDFTGDAVPVELMEFLPGCSWYCGAYIDTVWASSTLPPSGANRYDAIHAHDFDWQTAWVEGVEGDGVGESLTYVFDFTSQPQWEIGLTRLLIANGYKKNEQVWRANGRVARLRVYVDGAPYADAELVDTMEIQTVALAEIPLTNRRTVVRFEILGVYSGSRYADTALSLLMFDGSGVH